MITVNELFSGIGAFRKALINLNIPHQIVGISEIDKFAIKSYSALYGEPRNYGDISKVFKLDYADLWTYGFPCQDISNAGKKRGLIKNVTRSGLLYEVQRLLSVAALYDELPKYLIMENVKALVGKNFREDFDCWIEYLDKCGYNTYWKLLDATDYGVPQHRERVIAVSIRKDIDRGFEFPHPLPLTKKFRDFLEDRPLPKYFINNSYLDYLQKDNILKKAKGSGFLFCPTTRERASVAKTITTRKDSRCGNFIDEV